MEATKKINRGKHVLRICFVKFLMFRKQKAKTGISKIVYGSLITLIFVLEKLVSRKLKIFNFLQYYRNFSFCFSFCETRDSTEKLVSQTLFSKQVWQICFLVESHL